MRETFLLLSLIILNCVSSAEGPDIEGLIDNIKNQTGGTFWYDQTKNTIVENEPASSLLLAASNNRKEVVDALEVTVSDMSVAENCTHQGRSSVSKYTVGDIACYVLAQIHDLRAMEILIAEIQRRRTAGENPVPIIWAIEHYIPRDSTVALGPNWRVDARANGQFGSLLVETSRQTPHPMPIQADWLTLIETDANGHFTKLSIYNETTGSLEGYKLIDGVMTKTSSDSRQNPKTTEHQK